MACLFHGAVGQKDFDDVEADFYGWPAEQGQAVKPRAGQAVYSQV